MSRPVRKRGESGFALLLVFLMAAVIAITLYMEIPRVAFQSQRQKEQLLIERGLQYERAIQLFVRANNRYPGEIKELENFNNRRFLRHKFIDPMTGKDDWRLVHINNGVFTDSVLNKKKPGDQNKQDTSTQSTYIGVQPSLGQTPTPGQQNLNPAQTRRRASEGGPATPTVGPDGQPIIPSQPPAPEPPPNAGQPITALPTTPDSANPNPNSNPAQPQPLPGGQVPGGQLFAGQIPGQPFPGAQPNPNATPAFPGAQPNPNPAQPFPGAQPNGVGPVPPELANQLGQNPSAPVVPGAPLPGRQAGLIPPGAQNQPAQSSSSSYIGGSQSYIGGSQPYIGGGSYIGSSGSSGSTPSPAPFTPGQINAQPVANQMPFSGASPMGVSPVMPGQGLPITPGVPQGGNPGMPGAPGAPGSNAAANMINNLLTNPRAAPMAGAQPGGMQIGGGIAGVASKSENAAIMVFSDQKNYNEWEFVFDFTKQPPLPNVNGGVIGTPASALGSVPGSPAGPNAGPLATPSPTAAIGANPNATGTPGQGTQGAQGQAGAGKLVLPPDVRPGRP